jgi:hypothetical protein
LQSVSSYLLVWLLWPCAALCASAAVIFKVGTGKLVQDVKPLTFLFCHGFLMMEGAEVYHCDALPCLVTCALASSFNVSPPHTSKCATPGEASYWLGSSRTYSILLMDSLRASLG